MSFPCFPQVFLALLVFPTVVFSLFPSFLGFSLVVPSPSRRLSPSSVARRRPSPSSVIVRHRPCRPSLSVTRFGATQAHEGLVLQPLTFDPQLSTLRVSSQSINKSPLQKKTAKHKTKKQKQQKQTSTHTHKTTHKITQATTQIKHIKKGKPKHNKQQQNNNKNKTSTTKNNKMKVLSCSP